MNGSMNLEQELAGKVSKLDAQRREREDQMVTLILDRICEGIVSKEAGL